MTVDAEGRVTKLILNYNNLAGPLPSELQQLSALKVLYLNENQLSGPIPAELGRLRALTHLFLYSNPQLSGQAALHLHLQEHNPGCSLSWQSMFKVHALLCGN